MIAKKNPNIEGYLIITRDNGEFLKNTWENTAEKNQEFVLKDLHKKLADMQANIAFHEEMLAAIREYKKKGK